jgi:alpha-galactosidase
MRFLFPVFFLFCGLLIAQPQSSYDAATWTWTLSNTSIQAQFKLSESGSFQFLGIGHAGQPFTWAAREGSPSCPIRIVTSLANYGCWTRYRLVSHTALAIAGGGHRRSIVLDAVDRTARFFISLEIHPGVPVIRQSIRMRNLRLNRAAITEADLLPLTLADDHGPFESLRVHQWVHGGHTANFDPVQAVLEPEREVGAYTGAAGEHCSWIVLRGKEQQGLFAGWEFNGRAFGKFIHEPARGVVELQVPVLGLSPEVAPNGEFVLPAAFFGIFTGDWDEASWRTVSYVEAVIARRVSDSRFPYLMWDSWGYGEAINESALRRNAEIAASLGVEVFTVDLGWAVRIGDWRPDPLKFPSGLKALSDYVRSLGMKFGLHLAFAEAHAQAPVLLQNPDWRATNNDNYYGAESICLAHQPVREWVTSEILRVIDEYGVDWVLQDGENMVKRCNNPAHTHTPDDANYAGSVRGLDVVVDTVLRERPKVMWENCANGGAMMTYAMARRYVTSIGADNSGALPARRSLHGATYPFPPRYTARYMPEQDLTPAVTRSYMFGGPWILMNRLPQVSATSLSLLRTEIALYKKLRAHIRQGRVYHLTPPPAEGGVDAIQSLHPVTGASVIFAHRENGPASTRVYPRGLDDDGRYVVRFEDSGTVLRQSGAALKGQGIRVAFRSARDALVIYVDPE